MPEISVIVLNWNGKHFLEICLGSLRKQTFRDFEVILVDNGSEDGSAEYVRTHFPEVHLVALSQNLGFCGGNNAGYEHTKGDIVVLLNNDTEVHPDWLLELHNAAARYPNAGSFASKMLYFDERDRLDNCGFGLTSAGLTVDHGRGEIDGIAWAEPRSVFGACAGAGAYRRSMIEKIGFLDNDFFTFYEDVDLAFRAQLRGYDCVFIPGAIVYHRYRATMNKYRSRQIFLTQRNVEFVYLKNLPFGLMVRSLPQRVLYELGGFLYFAKVGVGTAFLKGKADALRNFPKIIRKRRIIQKEKTVTIGQLLRRTQGSWFLSKWKKLASAWRRVPQKALSPSESSS
jgi:GT2 family glycosyltransferase